MSAPRRPSPPWTTSRSGSPTATRSPTSPATHLGMHVIERTDDFTLVGADARRFKLTLFAAEGRASRARSSP